MENKKEIKDFEDRVQWVKNLLERTGAKGIVYGNSGGKDCTLVGAICKKACQNTVGIVMPCQSKQNYGSDRDDAYVAGEHFDIETLEIDLTKTKNELMQAIQPYINEDTVSEKDFYNCNININPRLRMTTLYAYGAANNCLVAGTGNLSERTMGYFTKWGDGACDFNPIADLTVTEVYAMLDAIGAPERFIKKAPSAGLYEGQTDEKDMGITYKAIDEYIREGKGTKEEKAKIENAKKATAHKRNVPLQYKNC